MVSRPRHSFTRKPNLADVKAAGHDMLRLVNRRILLNILSDRQPISRAEIAKISGLNKATISTITGELLKDSCIIEEGSGRTTPIGGKPPTPLRLNSKRFGLFGVDIRADETILALSDFNNRIVARISYETGSEATSFLNKISKEIRKLRTKHDSFIEFPGIGVSLPGLVDNHSGKFLLSVVLPWRDVPVVQLLEKATGLPVIIDNSARCSALAEIWHLPRGALGPVFASGFLGQLIGAVVAGPVADRVGRKSVIVAACVAFGLGALATTQASSLSTLLILRLLTGLGLGAALPNAVALTTEYSPVAHRSRMLVLVFCGITLGSVAAGLIAARLLPVFGWTAVFWVGGAVPLTQRGRPGPDPGRGDRYTAHQSSSPGRPPCRACPQGGPSRHASPRGC